jgi:phosphoribosylamine--glycine ligase
MGVVSGTSIQIVPGLARPQRLLDGDRVRTRRMGLRPVPDVDAAQLDEIRRTIIEPTLQGLAAEGIAYRGFLYFGLMLTAAGPKLLEYNARLGDPEAEVLLPALAGPLLPTLLASFDGTLERHPFAIKPGAVVDVVLAAGGYPNDVRAGVPIAGADDRRAGVPRGTKFATAR